MGGSVIMDTDKIATVYNARGEGFDFYVLYGQGKTFYNLVPVGSPAPDGGYFDSRYIFKVKGF